jgi:hypothetical protein
VPYFKLITIFSGTFAALCVLGIPLWILGVPGTQNAYAKGWEMGLGVILKYPAAWLAIYLPYFVLNKLLPTKAHQPLQALVGTLAILIALAAAFRLVQSIKTMS